MEEHQLLKQILDKITNGKLNQTELSQLSQVLNHVSNQQIDSQLGKYSVYIAEGNNIHIGDRIYHQWNEEAIKALIKEIQKNYWQCVASITEKDYTQVENQSTGIGFIDKISKQLTDISQQSVMRYGLKLAFSHNPNQEYFISGGNQIIKRWQIDTKEVLQEISTSFTISDTFDLWFTSVAISPDGKLIAGCKAYQVFVWRVGEDKPLYTFSKTLFSNFFDVFGFDCVVFSDDGKTLAANDNKNIKLWDMDTGKEIANLVSHQDKVTSIAFHPQNNNIIVSCSYDKSIKIWDLKTRSCITNLKNAHRDAIYTLAFNHSGEIFASGSEDNNIKLWQFSELEKKPTMLRQHEKSVTAIAFTPDKNTLISGGNDGKIIEWTTEGEMLSILPEIHSRGVTAIAISGNGKTLITAGRDQTIKIWSRESIDSKLA